jgi:putative FmdB family regulatory protein
MPIYEHKCNACQHEWEDIFKMSDPVPDECPECHEKGQVERLMSLCAGRVELTGHELTQHLVAEGRKLGREARTNENLAANIVGEEKFHKRELARSKKKKG